MPVSARVPTRPGASSLVITRSPSHESPSASTANTRVGKPGPRGVERPPQLVPERRRFGPERRILGQELEATLEVLRYQLHDRAFGHGDWGGGDVEAASFDPTDYAEPSEVMAWWPRPTHRPRLSLPP